MRLARFAGSAPGGCDLADWNGVSQGVHQDRICGYTDPTQTDHVCTMGGWRRKDDEQRAKAKNGGVHRLISVHMLEHTKDHLALGVTCPARSLTRALRSARSVQVVQVDSARSVRSCLRWAITGTCTRRLTSSCSSAPSSRWRASPQKSTPSMATTVAQLHVPFDPEMRVEPKVALGGLRSMPYTNPKREGLLLYSQLQHLRGVVTLGYSTRAFSQHQRWCSRFEVVPLNQR